MLTNASSSGFNWYVSRSDVRPNSNIVSAKSVEDETIKLTKLDIFAFCFDNYRTIRVNYKALEICKSAFMRSIFDAFFC